MCDDDDEDSPPLCDAHKRRRRADFIRLKKRVREETPEGREQHSGGGRHFDCLRDTLRSLGYFDLYLSGRIDHAVEPL